MPIASSLLDKPRLVEKLKKFYEYVQKKSTPSHYHILWHYNSSWSMDYLLYCLYFETVA